MQFDFSNGLKPQTRYRSWMLMEDFRLTSISHYLQSFIHPGCRISSINRMIGWSGIFCFFLEFLMVKRKVGLLYIMWGDFFKTHHLEGALT